KTPKVKSKLFWASLICHLIAGISVGLIYRYYYVANDTWTLFTEGNRLSEVAKNDFVLYIKLLFNLEDLQSLPNPVTDDFRSQIFVKIVSLFCLASGGNYWMCSGYFSLLS